MKISSIILQFFSLFVMIRREMEINATVDKINENTETLFNFQNQLSVDYQQ